MALVLGLVLCGQAWAEPPVAEAYSRFRNGPVFLAAGETQDVVHLDVTAGLYVIFAKGYAKVTYGGTTVDCKLIAGADTDRIKVGVDDRDVLRTDVEAFSLNVLHYFTSAGTILLRCYGDWSGDDVDLYQLKVTAMRVNSYWNLSE
jgi:hypothetical protein